MRRRLGLFADLGKAAADDIAAVLDPRYPANRERKLSAVGQFQFDALAVKERRGVQNADPAARYIARQHIAHLHRLVLAPVWRMDCRDRQRAEIMPTEFAILRTPLWNGCSR